MFCQIYEFEHNFPFKYSSQSIVHPIDPISSLNSNAFPFQIISIVCVNVMYKSKQHPISSNTIPTGPILIGDWAVVNYSESTYYIAQQINTWYTKGTEAHHSHTKHKLLAQHLVIGLEPCDILMEYLAFNSNPPCLHHTNRASTVAFLSLLFLPSPKHLGRGHVHCLCPILPTNRERKRESPNTVSVGSNSTRYFVRFHYVLIDSVA